MTPAIVGFDSHLRTRLIFGIGSVDRLGELSRELHGIRALVVTDPGIAAAGHLERARHSLAAAGLHVAVYDQVRENPTTRDVDDCVAVARDARIDLLIGLGGGSSIDTAKGCNFLLTQGGRLEEYWGFGKASQPMLPLIAVPTTAGTGSECQSYALIADEETHQKMACGDPKAAPRVALLDPALTVSQPPRVTACAGIDAIAHAVESAVTRSRNGLSSLYAREAFRLTMPHLTRVLDEPDDLEARAWMQLGAAYAGIAIEHSMLGAAHAAANPLTAHFGIIHGHAVGMMLPHVVRFNGAEPAAREIYQELARLGEPLATGEEAVDAFAGRLGALLGQAGLPLTLRDCGVTEGAVSELAAEAARQWTAQHNPITILAEDFRALYRQALGY
jgi:alcohol dehydrogenase